MEDDEKQFIITEMTKKEQFFNLVKAGASRKTLFYPILMHFAARHNSHSYGEFASDYKVLVESNLKCLEDFDLDIVSLISDPYRETAAFGAKIQFIPEGVPVCTHRVITSPEDILKLKSPDIYACARTLDRIKGVEYYKQELGNDLPIMGWIEGPLAEACDLAGVGEMLMHLMLEPELSGNLLEKCLVTAKEFAKAQLDAGCDFIGIGDAICSQIDAETYAKLVFARHKELVDYIHSLGALVKLHICGDTTHLWPFLSRLSVDIFDPDFMTDMEQARNLFGPAVILSGNINPIELQNLTADEAYGKSKKMVEENQGQKFILSAACEITVNTLPENLEAMRKAANAIS